jgi:uncharacterized Zn-finger protein
MMEGCENMKHTEAQSPACTTRQHLISKKDLPLSCPLPSEALWNAHPRVYLPIEESGHEVCPYCGTEYTLERS